MPLPLQSDTSMRLQSTAIHENFPFWEVIQMKAGTNLATLSNYFNTQGAKSTFQLDANFLIGLNISPYS
jgi:hypothetical protein